MPTFVYRDGKLVDKRYAEPKVTSGAATFVISDEMAPTRHMADGGTYTSKAKFRQVTRAHNCVEVGNDTAPLLKGRKPVQLDPGRRRDEIRRAIHELRNR